MAIDTNGEKASLINFGNPVPLMGPLLDGAFGQGEQQHLLNLYSGILAGSVISPDLAVSSKYIVRFKVKTPL